MTCTKRREADDQRLMANPGLPLPVTLAHHLGVGKLVDRHVDLVSAPGRADGRDKLLTLVASALAGGVCMERCADVQHRQSPGAWGRALAAPEKV